MGPLEKLANSFKGDEMIEIILDDGTSYNVQRAIFNDHSRYFKAALLKDFKEANEKTLRMPGCRTDVFQMMLHWMVRGEIPGLEMVYRIGVTPEMTDEAFQLLFVRVWVEADFYMMPDLQNATMGVLFQADGQIPVHPASVEVAFGCGAAGALLQKYLVQELVEDWIDADDGIEFGAPYCQDDFGAIPGFTAAMTNRIIVNMGKSGQKQESLSSRRWSKVWMVKCPEREE